MLKKSLEQDLLYMCNQVINKETLTEYFSGGFQDVLNQLVN